MANMGRGFDVGVVVTNQRGLLTATAGTAIELLSPGAGRDVRNAYCRLQRLVYRAAGTAHTLTILRALGVTTAAAAAAGQAVLTLAAQPQAGNDVAADDYLAWEVAEATAGGATLVHYLHGKVLSVSGLTITLTANLTRAVPAGSRVWLLGVAGDAAPSGEQQLTFSAPANAVTTLGGPDVDVACSGLLGAPILVLSNNATNAGQFEGAGYVWTTFAAAPFNAAGPTRQTLSV